jgi:hypothetical protein
MPTAKEYRQQAKESLRLAAETVDPRSKITMLELAEEFAKADELERRAARCIRTLSVESDRRSHPIGSSARRRNIG